MKTTTYAIATVTLLSLSTSSVFADSSTNSLDMMSILGRGDFCTTIKSIDTTSLSLPFGKPMQSLAEKKTGILEKISGKFRNRNDKRSEKVEDKSSNQSIRIAKKNAELRTLAKTDVEKAAVEKFIAATTAAEATKNTALDPIMKQLKIDTEALITSKAGVSSDKIAAAKTAMEAAVTKAKASCANGADPKTVKSEFKKAMESNVSIFRDFKPSASLRKELKLLERKNRNAIQAINDVFQDAMDDARDDLEAAMPNALRSDDSVRDDKEDRNGDDRRRGKFGGSDDRRGRGEN